VEAFEVIVSLFYFTSGTFADFFLFVFGGFADSFV
jgi:hypothetical protein